MGIGVLPSITGLTAPLRSDVHAADLSKFSNICQQQAQSRYASWCCFCTSKYNNVRADGSQWESRKQQPRYPRDQFSTEDNGFDEAEHSGFKSSVKQRIWWSEDSSWDLDDEDDDDNEIETGFGFFEGSLGFSSIFKVLRGFGWMIPAVIISMVLGTGSDTFFMALVLPLAQSTLSMAFDALWGTSTTGSMRPKKRSQKKRGFNGTTPRSETKKRREQHTKNTDDYKSWVASKNDASEKGEDKKSSFGGWDDLDKDWSNEEIRESSRIDEKRRFTQGKLSKRGRNRSKPFLVRMLVALFPFLGFWTKLL